MVCIWFRPVVEVKLAGPFAYSFLEGEFSKIIE